MINLVGVIAIVVTLLITRKDILERTGQPFYEDHLKSINELVEKEREVRNKKLLDFFQTDKRYKDRDIDLINLSFAYMNLHGILRFEGPLYNDITKLRSSKNIDVESFLSQEYHMYINYLRTFQSEIEIFYSHSIRHRLEKIISDERLTSRMRDLLYRHIQRYILRQYIMLCTILPDTEFYRIPKNEAVFENFKTNGVLLLFTYIKSVQELKEAFIPRRYWNKD